MQSTAQPIPNAKIEFCVCINLRGPIIPDVYGVGEATITVSYPTEVDFGFPTPIKLPSGVSTLFNVSWIDVVGDTARQMMEKSFERHLTIYKVLDLISRLLLAFKLVRVGHADGMRIRTIGIADTLFFFSRINGIDTGNLNMGLRLDQREYPWRAVGEHPFDHSGTTRLALEHVNATTFPIARKYVRCFELVEHGYYSEAIIVAHSNLDDLVQEMIHDGLHSKGLTGESERNTLLRAIKESRLHVYLGPLLKLVFGTTIAEIWPESDKALAWLNETRNKIAHRGFGASHDDASKAIFVCIKIIAALDKKGIVAAEFPKGMFRQARVAAAWTHSPQNWIPTGDAIENDPFDARN